MDIWFVSSTFKVEDGNKAIGCILQHAHLRFLKQGNESSHSYPSVAHIKNEFSSTSGC